MADHHRTHVRDQDQRLHARIPIVPRHPVRAVDRTAAAHTTADVEGGNDPTRHPGHGHVPGRGLHHRHPTDESIAVATVAAVVGMVTNVDEGIEAPHAAEAVVETGQIRIEA